MKDIVSNFSRIVMSSEALQTFVTKDLIRFVKDVVFYLRDRGYNIHFSLEEKNER